MGPFSVFILHDRPPPDQTEDFILAQNTNAPVEFPAASISDLDSILDIGSVLGKNNLFDTGLDFATTMKDKRTRIPQLRRVMLQADLLSFNDHLNSLMTAQFLVWLHPWS